jgi:hypothetical protein
MKKQILIGLFLLVAGISQSFANGEENVDAQVLHSFRKDFSSAQNVQWSNERNFVKATFTMDQHVVVAYYSDKGELLGVTRNITSNQLPITLLSDVRKNYKQYWIADLFEMAANGETSYYITLENGDQKLVLKSVNARGWQVFKKERKQDQ